MKLLFFSLKVLLLFSYLSCNTTEPFDDIKPGRRDYVWTVDTIKIPFNFLGRISGSSPDDVWAVGPGGGLDETIWHYDGNSWKTDGISRGISPFCVHAYSREDIWIAGFEGKIWHYNGSRWKQNIDFKMPNYRVGFVDIWGDSPENIYAVGYADSGEVRKGVILNFNGTNWVNKEIPFTPYTLLRVKRDIISNYYYILGYYSNEEELLTALYQYDGNIKIEKLYETRYGIDLSPYLQILTNKVYFLLGRKINTYEGTEFKLLTEINERNFIGQIWGRNSTDIFLLMSDGIAHYNGSDVEYLFKDENKSAIVDAAVFEKEVFFLAKDFNNDRNLIFHGKLK